MSLILEALKKSESERRLGQAPTLASSSEFVFHRRTKHGALVVAGMLALVALIAAVIAWKLSYDARAPGARLGPAAGTPIAGSAAAGVGAPRVGSSRPVEAVDSAVTAAIPAPESGPVRETPPSAPATPRPTIADEAILPRSVEFDSIERESTPVPAAVAGAARPHVAGLESTLLQPQSGNAVTHATTAPTSQQSAEHATPATDAESEWVRVEYLPAQERAALPPLRVTMHVFSAVPSARFVLIDGRRLIEGDRIDDTLQVLEIRRDGTVLDQGGRRLLLARP